MIRENKVYKVAVSGTPSIPPLCTCCMKSADALETVTYSLSKTISRSAKMPVCLECLRHRNKEKFYSKLITALSIVFGIIMFVILRVTDNEPSWLISTLSVPVVFFVLTLLITVKELPDEHSTRERSVFIRSKGADLMYPTEEQKNHITFTFTNRDYAKTFKATNPYITGDIVEVDALNTAKKLNIFSLYRGIFKSLLAITIIFAALSFFIAGELDEAEEANKPYLQYSENLGIGDKAQAKIVSAFPVIKSEDARTSMAEGVICMCETTDGSTLWAYIGIFAYKEHFDPDFDKNDYLPLTFEAEPVFLDTPITIYGTVEEANSLGDYVFSFTDDMGPTSQTIAEAINSEKVLKVTEVNKKQ